jgi:hypothetical protein
VTTAHQAFGALLLANATLAFAWCRRLLVAPPSIESARELVG